MKNNKKYSKINKIFQIEILIKKIVLVKFNNKMIIIAIFQKVPKNYLPYKTILRN